MDQLISNITRWYDLKLDYHRQTLRLEHLKSERSRCKWELHECSVAAVEFPSTLRGIKDKLFHHGEKLSELQKQEAQAREKLEQVTREYDRQKLTAEESLRRIHLIGSVEVLCGDKALAVAESALAVAV